MATSLPPLGLLDEYMAGLVERGMTTAEANQIAAAVPRRLAAFLVGHGFLASEAIRLGALLAPCLPSVRAMNIPAIQHRFEVNATNAQLLSTVVAHFNILLPAERARLREPPATNENVGNRAAA